MVRLVSISEAAEALGVSITTLRRWEHDGKLVAEHTVGGRRRYDLNKLYSGRLSIAKEDSRKTIAYARVSSHDQKNDLKRQKQVWLKNNKMKENLVRPLRGRTRFVDYFRDHFIVLRLY